MAVARDMFTGPAHCGEVREKSSVSRSPCTVMSRAMVSASSFTPSLSSMSLKL